MELDDETLETLGWGTQKAKEELARHVGYVQAYKTEYMRKWRKDNPDKSKAIYLKRWKTIKADPVLHAKAKAQAAKYYKKRKIKFKTDPVFVAAFTARLERRDAKRKLRESKTKRGTTTTNSTTRT